VKGFGRGSKSLGIPTANYEQSVVDQLPEELTKGIYFGWAQVDQSPIYKCCLSLGWNPYFGNIVKSMVCVYSWLLYLYRSCMFGWFICSWTLGTPANQYKPRWLRHSNPFWNTTMQIVLKELLTNWKTSWFFVIQETHIIHKFDEDFYGSTLKVCVAGYIRDEMNFSSIGKFGLKLWRWNKQFSNLSSFSRRIKRSNPQRYTIRN